MPILEESWNECARALGFESEEKMLRSLYLDEGFSLNELAGVVERSALTVRRRLILLGINLRGRGGPNRTGKRHLVHVDDVDLKFGKPEEIARREGVHISTVFAEKRLRRALKGEAWNSLSSVPKTSSSSSEGEPGTTSSSPSTVTEETTSSITTEELGEEM